MSDESTAVILARLEGKIDLLHAELRSTNARGEDHEARIRALEARPEGITPKTLLTTVAGCVSILAGAVAVVAFLIRLY